MPSFSGFTVTLRFLASPASMLPRFQVNVLPDTEACGEVVTREVPVGMVSVTTTLPAQPVASAFRS